MTTMARKTNSYYCIPTGNRPEKGKEFEIMCTELSILCIQSSFCGCKIAVKTAAHAVVEVMLWLFFMFSHCVGTLTSSQCDPSFLKTTTTNVATPTTAWKLRAPVSSSIRILVKTQR